MIRIAIYDMDKTLTRAASFGPFILFVLKKYRPWRVWALPLMALVTLGYALKLISRSRLKEINLRLLMGRRIDAAKMADIAEKFTLEWFCADTPPQARLRLIADREAGYRIVLATASYRLYVEAIAALLHVDAVIATDCKTDGAGMILPQIDGENCYGEGKLRMVRAWLAEEGIDRIAAHIRFYSDHVSDAPCLDWADEAFAINAHPPLRRLAEQKGWTQINWR
jgi:HAD superfamily hydrolase (TIGR01490 family)